MQCNCQRTDDEYPQLSAETTGFRKGAPRSFSISSAGHRAAFVRSASGQSSVNDLWVIDHLDSKPVERLLVRAVDCVADDEHLSPAERARRERLREVGAGITGFSHDDLMSTFVFPLSGQLWTCDGATGAVVRLGEYSSVVDPRLNSRGDAVAFSEGADFVVYSLAAEQELLRIKSEAETVSYGLADFVASEELERYRGHWWSSDGAHLLVERNDEAPVAVRWIADPTYPEQEPRPHRYPQAGTANSLVSLVLVDLAAGSQTAIAWARDEFEYLENVQWSGERAFVTLLSRDQRTQAMFEVVDGGLAERARKTDPHWVDAAVGVPTLLDDFMLESEERDDARVLRHRFGELDFRLHNRERHIEQVLDANETHGIAVALYNEPWQRQIVQMTKQGLRNLSDADGYATGIVSGEYAVVVQHRADLVQAEYRVLRSGEVVHHITNCAVRPPVVPTPVIASVTERALPTAIIWPEGHVPGSHKLPVIVNIYGGPHHSEVIASAASFASDQWLANQGYAVVIIDNRGTPGKGPAWERAVSGDLNHPVLEDQLAGLQALLAANPDLDAERVGMNGWSFGGFLSALAVLAAPEVYKAAWAGAPVSDWRLYDTAYTERYLGHPDAHPENYDGSGLAQYAKQLRRPLALVHGLADDNVLAAHSLQLSGAFLAAGRPHLFLPMAGVSHMTPQVDIMRNLLLLMRSFFDTHLGVVR